MFFFVLFYFRPIHKELGSHQQNFNIMLTNSTNFNHTFKKPFKCVAKILCNFVILWYDEKNKPEVWIFGRVKWLSTYLPKSSFWVGKDQMKNFLKYGLVSTWTHNFNPAKKLAHLTVEETKGLAALYGPCHKICGWT